MKFLLSVLAFNFLCVWCFGFEDCEGDDVCQEILTISTTLENQVAYTDQEAVVYGFSDELNTIPVVIHRFRQEGIINGCEDKITVLAAASIGNRSFEFTIETFISGANGILLTTSLNDVDDERVIFVAYDEQGIPSLQSPDQLRIIPDTVFSGVVYEDVLAIDFAVEPNLNRLKRIFYHREGGLLKADRTDGATVFRID